MILNKKELKKIQYDFNSNSNRLLQADYTEYTSELKKYIRFLRNTEVIYSYILDCGKSEIDPHNEIIEVQQSYGRKTFSTGETDEEEVRNIFSILAYIADKDIDISFAATLSYCHGSDKYQDGIDSFNSRYVMILIRDIDKYLTDLGIDMGLDENVKYNISIKNGMVNIASGQGTINAENTVNNSVDEEKLMVLMNEVRKASLSANSEEIENINTSLDVIKEELTKGKPRKSVVKLAIDALQGIKGGTEFAAAVAQLVSFVMSVAP